MKTTLLSLARLVAFVLVAAALAGLLAGCSYPPRGDPGGQRDPYERGSYDGRSRYDSGSITQVWFGFNSRSHGRHHHHHSHRSHGGGWGGRPGCDTGGGRGWNRH